MTHNPDFRFHQTAAQLRRVAARGGRTSARNRRARLRTAPTPARQTGPPPQPLAETTRNHLLRSRELFSQGKWAEAGKELDAIEAEVRK